MELIFRWSATRPALTLGLTLLACLALSGGMARLRIDASFERLLSESDPRTIEARNLRENFGFRPLVAVVAESPDLFDWRKLSALKRLDANLSEIPGIVATSNLFTTEMPVSRGDVVFAAPPLAEIPADPDSLNAKRAELLANELIRGHLLNDRGDALLLVYHLENEKAGEDLHARTLAEFEKVLRADPASQAPDLDLSVFGIPWIKKALQDHLLWDMTRLAPIALLVVGAVIFLFYRSFAAVFLPLITGVLSSFATLGFMGYAGFPINIFLSTIVILILVLGCTEDLHILSEYLDNLDAGMERFEAICHTGATTGKALLLTSATTVFSFLSIAFTDFDGLRHFAVSCAVGMAVNFLVTILTIPAILALIPRPRPFRRVTGGLLAWLSATLERSLFSGRKGPVLLCAGLFAVSLLGGARLERETDFLRFFWPGSETSRAIGNFTAAFGGTASVVVTMETKLRNGFREPERFRDLIRLHDFLTAEYGSPLDLTSLYAEFRKAEGATPPTAESPPSAEELAKFLSVLPREAAKPFLDYDGSRAAIQVLAQGYSSSSRSILEIEGRVQEFARRTFGPEVEVQVAGDQVVTAHLCDQVIQRLLRNLVILTLVTALAISLAVGSLKMGFLAIIPNLFPIATTFGAMGWFGIPLGVSTFPVAIVAFGIAVDDTIHLLLRLNTERRRGLGLDEAVASGLRRELRPVVATSITVACGYLIMGLSPLRSNAEVGLLFSLASLSALFADLVVTPILLRGFSKRESPGAVSDSG